MNFKLVFKSVSQSILKDNFFFQTSRSFHSQATPALRSLRIQKRHRIGKQKTEKSESNLEVGEISEFSKILPCTTLTKEDII
jgi:hypothetical protein